ncbi:DNA-(apurinic or apyrimidinic site) lyase [Striga hermonthica]|uniref:DNA-(apurinic or apyrimidinic site) endonuclease n=1 Tax=Striga hermonthica TaxID=68872 RepID=A0A9N7R637_STRHE|nr:DNA-(apurinic or apyrimidinic site) lyase [Striga hermonthica]
MKRFFKPIEKDGSSKKPNLSSSLPLNDCPKVTNGASVAASEENSGAVKEEPLKFLSWNANSLLLRIKNNWTEFSKFVENLDPDVIALQEVRIPAAGAKGAPRNPRELKDDTSASREEKQIVMRALSNPPFKNYNVWWSLSDSKYAGTALLIKKCFQPIKVSFSLDQAGSKHEADGRVIIAEFESFRILNTYVPNNGWKEEESSFQRRRKWDKRMLEFVLRASDKSLIWCGDLNVSHPEFFSAAKLNGYVPPNKEDYGQPGFTLAERRRFGLILKEGKLVDAYRHLHKDKDMERGFSWSGNPIGKYRGKRMRIDYFVVSDELKERIVSCEMHGHGIELEGFFGSDHCPVSLEISDSKSKL